MPARYSLTEMDTVWHWFRQNAGYVVGLSAIVVILRWRHLDQKLRWLGLFIGVSVLGETVSHITAHVLHMNNLYLFHTYTLLEFNAIAWFYKQLFESFYPRWFVVGLMLFFTAFALLNSLYIQPVTGFHTYALGLECLLIIGLALLLYYQMLAEMKTDRLNTSPVFWINTGFLVYFAGSLFVFMLQNILLAQPNRDLGIVAGTIHRVVLLVLHVFISIGLWLSPARSQIYR